MSFRINSRLSGQISSARVSLGHKTSRYQTSIANDIFVFRRNFFYLSPASLRSSSPCLAFSLYLFLLLFCLFTIRLVHPKTPQRQMPCLCVLFFTRQYVAAFSCLAFVPSASYSFSPPTSFSIFRALGLSFPFLKINGQSDRLRIPEMKLLQVRGLFLLERYLAIYISCVVGDYAKCICDVMSFRRHLVPGELQFQSCNGA